MVTLYVGTPGSGKSYHATRTVHKAVRQGVNVIANFIINLPEKYKNRFYYIPTRYISVAYLKQFYESNHVPNKEHQTMIMIDEASVLFNPRDFARSDRDEWIQFFREHRKLGYDVILITQQDRFLDRQIRGQIEFMYRHRKLANFGFKGIVIRLITHMQFIAIMEWYACHNEKIGVEYFRINKRIANSYDTFATFSAETSTEEISGFEAYPVKKTKEAVKIKLNNLERG